MMLRPERKTLERTWCDYGADPCVVRENRGSLTTIRTADGTPAERRGRPIRGRPARSRSSLLCRSEQRLTNLLTNLIPHRLAVAERLSSVVPTCLARLAACFSYRLSLFKRRSEQTPHEPPHEPQPVRTRGRLSPIAVAERLSSIVPTCLARLAACVSLIGSRSSNAAASEAPHEAPHEPQPAPTRGRLDPNRGRRAPLVDRPDVSRAPRGVRLLSAPALQAPQREAPHEAPHEPQPVRPRGRLDPNRGRQAPLVDRPDVSRALAACFSNRLPLFKRRVAKRLTNRFTNLSPHRPAVDSIQNAVAADGGFFRHHLGVGERRRQPTSPVTALTQYSVVFIAELLHCEKRRCCRLSTPGKSTATADPPAPGDSRLKNIELLDSVSPPFVGQQLQQLVRRVADRRRIRRLMPVAT